MTRVGNETKKRGKEWIMSVILLVRDGTGKKEGLGIMLLACGGCDCLQSPKAIVAPLCHSVRNSLRSATLQCEMHYSPFRGGGNELRSQSQFCGRLLFLRADADAVGGLSSVADDKQ